jgi:hypothetical protein
MGEPPQVINSIDHYYGSPTTVKTLFCPVVFLNEIKERLEVQPDNRMDWLGTLGSVVCFDVPCASLCCMCAGPKEEGCCYDYAGLLSAASCLFIGCETCQLREAFVKERLIVEDQCTTCCVSWFCWPCALAQMYDLTKRFTY